MAIDLPEFNTTEYDDSIRSQHLINMKALRQKFGIDEDHHVLEGFPEEVGFQKLLKKLVLKW